MRCQRAVPGQPPCSNHAAGEVTLRTSRGEIRRALCTPCRTELHRRGLVVPEPGSAGADPVPTPVPLEEDPMSRSRAQARATCRWPGCTNTTVAQGLCVRDLGRAHTHVQRKTGPIADDEVAAAAQAWEAAHAPTVPAEPVRKPKVPAVKASPAAMEALGVKVGELEELADALSLVHGLTWDELLVEARRLVEERDDARRRLGATARELEVVQARSSAQQTAHEHNVAVQADLRAEISRWSQRLEEAEGQARNSHEAAQMWRHAVCTALGLDPDKVGLGEIPLEIARRLSEAREQARGAGLAQAVRTLAHQLWTRPMLRGTAATIFFAPDAPWEAMVEVLVAADPAQLCMPLAAALLKQPANYQPIRPPAISDGAQALAGRPMRWSIYPLGTRWGVARAIGGDLLEIEDTEGRTVGVTINDRGLRWEPIDDDELQRVRDNVAARKARADRLHQAAAAPEVRELVLESAADEHRNASVTIQLEGESRSCFLHYLAEVSPWTRARAKRRARCTVSDSRVFVHRWESEPEALPATPEEPEPEPIEIPFIHHSPCLVRSAS